MGYTRKLKNGDIQVMGFNKERMRSFKDRFMGYDVVYGKIPRNRDYPITAIVLNDNLQDVTRDVNDIFKKYPAKGKRAPMNASQRASSRAAGVVKRKATMRSRGPAIKAKAVATRNRTRAADMSAGKYTRAAIRAVIKSFGYNGIRRDALNGIFRYACSHTSSVLDKIEDMRRGQYKNRKFVTNAMVGIALRSVGIKGAPGYRASAAKRAVGKRLGERSRTIRGGGGPTRSSIKKKGSRRSRKRVIVDDDEASGDLYDVLF